MQHIWIVSQVHHQPEDKMEQKPMVDWHLILMIAVTIIYAGVALWLA